MSGIFTIAFVEVSTLIEPGKVAVQKSGSNYINILDKGYSLCTIIMDNGLQPLDAFSQSHFSAQLKLCSLNARCFSSFSLVLYSQSSFGQSIAISESYHGIPPSDVGS